jgi:hypothetical protein
LMVGNLEVDKLMVGNLEAGIRMYICTYMAPSLFPQ